MCLVKRFTVALVMVALLTGCGSPEQPSAPSDHPPPGVSVSLAQWRSDEPAHALEVAVRNTSDTPVYFADLQLVTASFKTLPPQKADSVIKRTERTDLRIPFGPAVCTPQRLPDLRPATVVARVRTGSEPLRTVVFPVAHPDPLLAKLLRDECSEFLVRQAVDIAFGQDWTESGGAMRGSLVLTRRAPGTVTLEEMGGTTHYMVEPEHAGRPLAVMDASVPTMRVPIALTPARCDAHAFAEAKKAFLFPVRAAIDGGQVRVVTVVPPEPLQGRLIQYALRACGLGR
ncbi:hypothetical protein SAMN05660976_02206 [Nonomuraea pusilla]|uniref:Lipoprotein n=1 Tax=Nonomuraea pusilla TaxID=46177 RepID=A0A1H7NZG7_9ACTN|nr:hypothetical protein SAMN05660976_02206 [Nonomuraea pusilla]